MNVVGDISLLYGVELHLIAVFWCKIIMHVKFYTLLKLNMIYPYNDTCDYSLIVINCCQWWGDISLSIVCYFVSLPFKSFPLY